MKKHTQIFAAGVALAMILSLGACSVTVDKPDEGVTTTEVIEATAVLEPEAKSLTEEDLLPYLEFHDLFIRRMDEPIEVFEDTGGDEAEEPTEVEDTGEADTDTGGEEAPEAEIEDTGGDEAATLDENEDQDPMGYIASITKYYEETVQNEVIRNISYDSAAIDVIVTGEYEITYTATIDRDAYDAALLVKGEGEAKTEDVALELTEGKDEYYVKNPGTEVLGLENDEEVIIVKTVFVVDEDVFDEMATTEGSVVVNDWILYTVAVEDESESESDTEVESEADDTNGISNSTANMNDSTEVKDTSNSTSSNSNSTSDSGNGESGVSVTTKPAATAKPASSTKPVATAKPTPTSHIHSWSTKTEKIAETGHWESVKIGTQSVDKGYWDRGITGYKCNGCGATFGMSEAEGERLTIHVLEEMTSYSATYGDIWVSSWTEEPVYEDQWVVDTPASTRTYEVCSTCGILTQGTVLCVGKLRRK